MLPLLSSLARCSSELQDVNYWVLMKDDYLLASVDADENAKTDELDLSSRGIRSVAKEAFNGAPNLRSLSLANNSLASLPEFAFSKLTKLERLSIADNKIDSTRHLFIGLQSLEYLNFSNNPVKHLRSGHLHGMPLNVELCVRGDNIYSISSHVFRNPFLRLPPQGKEKIYIAPSPKFTDQQITEDVEPTRRETSKQQQAEHLRREYERDSQPLLHQALRLKACLSDGVVQSLQTLEETGNLTKDCREVEVDHANRRVNLSGLGIRGFKSGWYQLGDLPILTLDLADNMIDEVTREMLNELPSNVVAIDMCNNRIERVRSGVIENRHIRELFLRNNLLVDIERDALWNTDLVGLYLNRNGFANLKFIADLPPTLRKLDLSDNSRPLTITSDLFTKLSELRFLNLNNNTLSRIASDAFKGLGNLDILALDSNNLTTLELNCFEGLRKLTALTLRNNSISEMNSRVFDDLKGLRQLVFSHNKFNAVPRGFLAGMSTTLVNLDLSHNEIESIEEDGLIHPSLSELSLR